MLLSIPIIMYLFFFPLSITFSCNNSWAGLIYVLFNLHKILCIFSYRCSCSISSCAKFLLLNLLKYLNFILMVFFNLCDLGLMFFYLCFLLSPSTIRFFNLSFQVL
ncbi:unnamed protein product [Moneuplotes crassus]|uniref:Uncharacterized protein n=1 Tax=Euplotes crassus TaxID=5936 RepID=A0AAD1UGL1_EUPCR|nr:unnamed protein product [Moneuplotes crassus]